MDKKFIIGIVLFTLLIIGGAIFYGNNSSSKAAVEKTSGAKIQTFEEDFDFKEIKYDGGNAKHPFKIKNVGTKDLTIANMVTSCMCTEVYLKTKTGESPKFGMKGHATESKWTGSLRLGEEAEVVVDFDPTAHGPQGVGPISRIVSFETNDPDKPYVEFSFSGNVIK
ncbi:MAG: hypothetical protein A3C22_02190 [Candidatus Levybacteria bacterium RIFCSPHIGHO2_02_FULL_37_10]|nr:MAG: hypothetical protein A3C22_02190 [Candidatus Levybacteria bacterium RIFCSPHIGHO2_02_FULL_37_10]